EALDQHLAIAAGAIDDDRILHLLHRLPAPHVRGIRRLRSLELRDGDAIDRLAERVGPKRGRVARNLRARIAEAAIAVARATVVAEREPVQIEILATCLCGALANRSVD